MGNISTHKSESGQTGGRIVMLKGDYNAIMQLCTSTPDDYPRGSCSFSTMVHALPTEVDRQRHTLSQLPPSGNQPVTSIATLFCQCSAAPGAAPGYTIDFAPFDIIESYHLIPSEGMNRKKPPVESRHPSIGWISYLHRIIICLSETGRAGRRRTTAESWILAFRVLFIWKQYTTTLKDPHTFSSPVIP